MEQLKKKMENTQYIKDLNYLLNSFKSAMKYYPLSDKEVAIEKFEEIIKDLKNERNIAQN